MGIEPCDENRSLYSSWGWECAEHPELWSNPGYFRAPIGNVGEGASMLIVIRCGGRSLMLAPREQAHLSSSRTARDRLPGSALTCSSDAAVQPREILLVAGWFVGLAGKHLHLCRL